MAGNLALPACVDLTSAIRCVTALVRFAPPLLQLVPLSRVLQVRGQALGWGLSLWQVHQEGLCSGML